MSSQGKSCFIFLFNFKQIPRLLIYLLPPVLELNAEKKFLNIVVLKSNCVNVLTFLHKLSLCKQTGIERVNKIFILGVMIRSDIVTIKK